MTTKSSKILNTKRITTKMMYKTYIKEYPESIIAINKDYTLFKLIVVETHKEAVQECLKGGQYHFGSNIGMLEIMKYNRELYLDADGKPKGMAVDFGATRKNKAAGNTEVIYHTNTLICRWMWSKSEGFSAKNRKGWQLAVTNGPKGITRKLAHFITNNEKAAVNYRDTFKYIKEEIKDV